MFDAPVSHRKASPSRAGELVEVAQMSGHAVRTVKGKLRRLRAKVVAVVMMFFAINFALLGMALLAEGGLDSIVSFGGAGLLGYFGYRKLRKPRREA